MDVTFTGHNIRLDDGTLTRPDAAVTMDAHPWLVAARRVLETVFPGDKSRYRLADLGCLEGGYAVEFARMGFQVLGIEVRDSNIAACRYVQARTRLPNLDFVQDDARHIGRYGPFDAVFCGGLLYHLDRPRQFLADDAALRNQGESRWAAWDNRRSFWVRREHLLQALRDVGFDLVLEQFDGLGPDVVGSMTGGYYTTHDRGTFVGIKTGAG